MLLTVVLLLTLASKLCNIALPLVMRHVVNILSGVDDGGVDLPATTLVVVYCSLTAAAEGFVQLQQAVWGRLFYRITQRVSLALFEHLHSLSMRWHLERKTGAVLAVVNQGVGVRRSRLVHPATSLASPSLRLLSAVRCLLRTGGSTTRRSGRSASAQAVGNLLQIATFQIGATLVELGLTSAVFFTLGVPSISLCVTASSLASPAQIIVWQGVPAASICVCAGGRAAHALAHFTSHGP
jgi:ABC-type multidrug transport system fused ATPase/permease subunit